MAYHQRIEPAVGLCGAHHIARPGVDAGSLRSHAAGQEVKIPQTVQWRLDLAERYRKNAAEYRQEVDMHKKMLAEYSKRVARNPKDPGENPYIRKMRLHCERRIGAAESLAREADEMAKFHTFRARELESK